MTHLLKMLDLSGEEIANLLNLADQLKYEQKHDISHRRLEGKSVGMVFYKPSTRTRVSFEVAMVQLGGHPVALHSREMQIYRGETVQDTARALSRYLDAVLVRTLNHAELEEFARYSTVPVINGLSALAHPCQALADLMTIRERKNGLEGLRICYIGDGNNMANSLTVGALKCGMDVSLATPPGYEPHERVLAFAEAYSGHFVLTENVMEAAEDADVLVTDTWISMGREAEEGERLQAFLGYQINDEVLAVAAPDAMVLHSLPVRRGQEMTNSVFEAHAEGIFEAAENRLYAQKAILLQLLAPSG